MKIEPITRLDEQQVLVLNNRHAEELSLLDAGRLAGMISDAFYANRVGSLDAFLIAFDQSADYDSPNFHWFRERLPRFVYVDRIAVDEAARGRGLARALYEDLFQAATVAGHDKVVCEVNAEPPNPASDAFHASLGFIEIGTAQIHGGSKTVRYFSRAL